MEYSPKRIVQFQGGDGRRNGQLAYDIPPNRLTSETDLLLQEEAPTELLLVDWKSGHQFWTASGVKAAFQFQFLALLIFRNFEIERLNVKVLNTRLKSWTSPVTFSAYDIDAIESRVVSALMARSEALDDDNPSYWPELSKCQICPAVMDCADANDDATEICKDAAAFARATMRRRIACDKKTKMLMKHVQEFGPILWDGGSYGPKPPSKPKVTYAFGGK